MGDIRNILKGTVVDAVAPSYNAALDLTHYYYIRSEMANGKELLLYCVNHCGKCVGRGKKFIYVPWKNSFGGAVYINLLGEAYRPLLQNVCMSDFIRQGLLSQAGMKNYRILQNYLAVCSIVLSHVKTAYWILEPISKYAQERGDTSIAEVASQELAVLNERSHHAEKLLSPLKGLVRKFLEAAPRRANIAERKIEIITRPNSIDVQRIAAILNLPKDPSTLESLRRYLRKYREQGHITSVNKGKHFIFEGGTEEFLDVLRLLRSETKLMTKAKK